MTNFFIIIHCIFLFFYFFDNKRKWCLAFIFNKFE